MFVCVCVCLCLCLCVCFRVWVCVCVCFCACVVVVVGCGLWVVCFVRCRDYVTLPVHSQLDDQLLTVQEFKEALFEVRHQAIDLCIWSPE